MASVCRREPGMGLQPLTVVQLQSRLRFALTGFPLQILFPEPSLVSRVPTCFSNALLVRAGRVAGGEIPLALLTPGLIGATVMAASFPGDCGRNGLVLVDRGWRLAQGGLQPGKSSSKCSVLLGTTKGPRVGNS